MTPQTHGSAAVAGGQPQMQPPKQQHVHMGAHGHQGTGEAAGAARGGGTASAAAAGARPTQGGGALAAQGTVLGGVACCCCMKLCLGEHCGMCTGDACVPILCGPCIALHHTAAGGLCLPILCCPCLCVGELCADLLGECWDCFGCC